MNKFVERKVKRNTTNARMQGTGWGSANQSVLTPTQMAAARTPGQSAWYPTSQPGSAAPAPGAVATMVQQASQTDFAKPSIFGDITDDIYNLQYSIAANSPPAPPPAYPMWGGYAYAPPQPMYGMPPPMYGMPPPMYGMPPPMYAPAPVPTSAPAPAPVVKSLADIPTKDYSEDSWMVADDPLASTAITRPWDAELKKTVYGVKARPSMPQPYAQPPQPQTMAQPPQMMMPRPIAPGQIHPPVRPPLSALDGRDLQIRWVRAGSSEVQPDWRPWIETLDGGAIAYILTSDPDILKSFVSKQIPESTRRTSWFADFVRTQEMFDATNEDMPAQARPSSPRENPDWVNPRDAKLVYDVPQAKADVAPTLVVTPEAAEYQRQIFNLRTSLGMMFKQRGKKTPKYTRDMAAFVSILQKAGLYDHILSSEYGSKSSGHRDKQALVRRMANGGADPEDPADTPQEAQAFRVGYMANVPGQSTVSSIDQPSGPINAVPSSPVPVPSSPVDAASPVNAAQGLLPGMAELLGPSSSNVLQSSDVIGGLT